VYGKTVILATGGYIGNSEMKMQYFGSDLREEAVHTDQGDGIKMAHNVGAGDYNIDMPATVHISQVKNIIYQPINSNAAKSAQWKATLTNLLTKGDSLLIGLKKGQAGDLRGQRFCNEGAMMAGGAAFENWKVGGYFAAIYSNDVLESYKINGYEKTAMQFFLGQGQPIEVDTPITELDQILAEGEKYGNVVRAASLTELAQKLEIAEKAQTLRDTIIQYNKYVDGSATDNSFPKFMFGPPVPDPSFYTYQINPDATGYTAILGAGYYYGTGGGLDVDTDMQVLNTSKEKIPGLYAVGQDSMGVLFNAKKAYVGYGAAAQGWAITSGRIAGAKAAAAATQ
jgi:succinate dehydrogenase/fumarate reductase flavoprotein subunit